MLRKIVIALLCVFAPTLAHAQATVSGNLKNLGAANITGSNTFVRFTLEGYGANIPRVSGTDVIVPGHQDFHPDTNGNISGDIQGNDTISVGANSPGGTWYQVCIYYQGQIYQCNNFTITGASFNLNNATPNTTNPTIPAPTGDTTYLRLDGGNSPVTGPTNFTGGLTAKTLVHVLHVDSSNSQGWSGSDLGAWINSAIAALPTVSDSYHSNSPQGVIVIDPGTYTQTTAVSITSNLVSVVGVDSRTTTINSSLSGVCDLSYIPTYSAGPGVLDPNGSGELGGFTLNGNSNASTCGIHYADTIGLKLHDLRVNNFTGSGSAGIWEDAINYFTERSVWDNVMLSNSTIDWHLTVQSTAVDYPDTTLGYGFFNVSMNCNSGQECIQQDSGIFNESMIHIVCNMGNSGSPTCLDITGGSPTEWGPNLSFLHAEGTGQAINTASGSLLVYSGPVEDAQATISDSYSGTVQFDYTDTNGNHIVKSNRQGPMVTTVESVTAVGGTIASDFQDGSGHPLTLFTEDGSNNGEIGLPSDSDTYLGIFNPGTLSANRTWTMPNVSGNVSLVNPYSCGTSAACSPTIQPAAHEFYGTVALSSGSPSTVTVTGFSPAFTSTSSYGCTLTNTTTAADGVKVTNTSTSSITITGPNTVTDTIFYDCKGI